MGFVSKAQVRKMWRDHPEVAKVMMGTTLDIRRLPERAKIKGNKGRKNNPSKS